MIYREDSIKNLMNNSIVRYDDPAVLEAAKKQMGMTVRFQFSCASTTTEADKLLEIGIDEYQDYEQRM